jgi:hypothetical protein
MILIFITRRHVEQALHLISLHGCGTTTFTDWVWVAPINLRRLSDHLLHDLKHDNTLPPTFDDLNQFRSYLRSQHACPAAMRLVRPVWLRYRRWVAKREAAS